MSKYEEKLREAEANPQLSRNWTEFEKYLAKELQREREWFCHPHYTIPSSRSEVKGSLWGVGAIFATLFISVNMVLWAASGAWNTVPTGGQALLMILGVCTVMAYVGAMAGIGEE